MVHFAAYIASETPTQCFSVALNDRVIVPDNPQNCAFSLLLLLLLLSSSLLLLKI